MSAFNMELPSITENDLKTEQGIKAVMDYLYMLNEQLKYTLAHLNLDENMDSDSIQKLLNMSKSIELVAENIKLYAKKGELSAELSLEDGVISLVGNRIIIDSDKFKVSANGQIECTDGKFSSSDGTNTITLKDGQMSMNAGSMSGFINPAQLYLSVTNGYYSQITGGSGVFSNNVNSSIVSATNYVQAPTIMGNTLIGALASGLVSLTYGSDANYGTFVQIGGESIPTIAYVINAAVIIASNMMAANGSDLRIKQDIASLDTLETKDKWLEFLDEMKIKSFSYKPDTYVLDDGKKHLGAIAQLIERSLEEKGLSDYGLIRELDYMEDSKAGEYTGGEKIKAVDYVGMIPLLVLGYQDVKKENRELHARLETLEKEMEEIKSMLKGEDTDGTEC